MVLATTVDAFEKLLDPQATPEVFIQITNANGSRTYGAQLPPVAIARTADLIADGTFFADGSVIAGQDFADVLEALPFLLDAGSLREQLQADATRPVTGIREVEFTGSEPGGPVVISNAKDSSGRHHISQIIARENLLGATVTYVVFYRGTQKIDLIQLQTAKVVGYVLTKDRVELSVEAV